MTEIREIFTIGHSTRSADEFSALLTEYDVEFLADVRSYPTSRHCPQFNRDAIGASLPDGVRYAHLAALGGRRGKQPGVEEATNAGWEHPSFRHYADYMQTPAFVTGIDELTTLAEKHRVAYMCAEAVPWRCHRSLISDQLVADGFAVVHILGSGQSRRHEPGAWGAAPVFRGGRVTYPGDAALL